MYESLLPERVRPAYRLSRWKKLLDERAQGLLARDHTPKTVGQYLTAWVEYVVDYEYEGAVLPSDIRSSEVVSYLDWRCSGRIDDHHYVCAALYQLLDAEGEWASWRQPMSVPAALLYEQHVPPYLAFAQLHRGCRSSRSVVWVLRDFFEWIAGQGVREIGEVGPSELRDFIANQGHLKRSTVSGQASALRCFFRYLGMSGVTRPGLDLIIESPRRYRMSAPPSVLEDKTVERLLAAVDRATPIGKRDYAILVLAARYGMRPSDIRGLRLDDIHWREQRIVILQLKTQRPLELPLVADVDEALVDYLRNGRPTCEAREVFVRHRPPIVPFVKTNNLWGIMQRAFVAAGIEPPKGQRGFYLLRHTAATRMLGNGVPFDTISDVLGHASVETTRMYAQVDLQGLRSVALSAGEVSR